MRLVLVLQMPYLTPSDLLVDLVLRAPANDASVKKVVAHGNSARPMCASGKFKAWWD